MMTWNLKVMATFRKYCVIYLSERSQGNWSGSKSRAEMRGERTWYTWTKNGVEVIQMSKVVR